MTLREQILELLRLSPQTASGLARALRYDKSSIKQILRMMERQRLVTCTPLKRGKVPYKFWRLKAQLQR